MEEFLKEADLDYKALYLMKLHETKGFSCGIKNIDFIVTRVIGGWIYQRPDYTLVFVPFIPFRNEMNCQIDTEKEFGVNK